MHQAHPGDNQPCISCSRLADPVVRCLIRYVHKPLDPSTVQSSSLLPSEVTTLEHAKSIETQPLSGFTSPHRPVVVIGSPQGQQPLTSRADVPLVLGWLELFEAIILFAWWFHVVWRLRQTRKRRVTSLNIPLVPSPSSARADDQGANFESTRWTKAPLGM